MTVQDQQWRGSSLPEIGRGFSRIGMVVVGSKGVGSSNYMLLVLLFKREIAYIQELEARSSLHLSQLNVYTSATPWESNIALTHRRKCTVGRCAVNILAELREINIAGRATINSPAITDVKRCPITFIQQP